MIIALSLASCSPQMYPLKGKYLEKPYRTTSSKSFDEVWDNVIDLFATKGLSIKLIDKSSGLIVSEKTSLMNDYTYEYKGNLVDSDAYVVVSRVIMADQDINPESITAEWNVRVKPNGSNGSTVNVNLTNIQCSNSTKYKGGAVYYTAKSTGVFEKTFANMVK